MDSLASLEAALLDTYNSKARRSRTLYERATRVMPGGDTRTGTFYLPYPVFIAKGFGSRVWDADDNEYLDFLGNFTSLIHGHAHPRVTAAIQQQSERGTVHGSPGELQVRLAEVLTGRIASLEQIRFCNSGTEATHGALRVAKAFTGRSKIMKMEGGYHGSHDQVIVAMAPPYDLSPAPASGLSPGAVGEVVLGVFNDLDRTAELIRRHRNQLAAVIVEPVMGAAGTIPAEPEFLRGLREVTQECGVLLILDEIITFRLGYGGIQAAYGVQPDLTALGKLIGGGLPVGAFGGRADIMATFDPTRAGTISHSGTYNGNAATMAAGIAALELLTAEQIERINRLGDGLRARLQEVVNGMGVDAILTGKGSLLQIHFTAPPLRTARDAARGDPRLLRLLHLALLTRGIFVANRQLYVLSTPMGEQDTETFARAFEDGLGTIAAAARGGMTQMAHR